MALWSDGAAMTALFKPLPETISAEIQRAHIEHAFGFSGMRHNGGDTAYCIVADSRSVQVWTLTPCSLNEAAAIWAEIASKSVTVSLMRQAYSTVTGRDTDYVQ